MNDEVREALAEALRPLAEFVVENMPVIERCAVAYEQWGTNRLEALANGYLDLDA